MFIYGLRIRSFYKKDIWNVKYVFEICYDNRIIKSDNVLILECFATVEIERA